MGKSLLKFEIDHELRIRLRVRIKDGDKWKSSYKYTGVRLKKKSDWNIEKERVKSSDKQYEILNKQLEEFIQKYKHGVEIEQKKQDDDKNSYLNYFNEFKNAIPNYSTRVKYTSVYNKLIEYRDYCKIGDILFSDLTRQFVKGFKTYLETTPNQYKKKSAQHSTDKYIQIFRRVFNHIEECEIHVFPFNPFAGIKLTETHGKKERLTKEEYERLLNLDKKKTLEVYNEDTKLDIKERKLFHLVIDSRNKFILQLQFGGMRIKDFLMIKWENFYLHKTFIAFNYIASKTELSMDFAVSEKSIKFLTPYILAEMERLNY